MGFLGSSAGKESTCNAEDPSSIPGWGRSPGEGIGIFPDSYSLFLGRRSRAKALSLQGWILEGQLQSQNFPHSKAILLSSTEVAGAGGGGRCGGARQYSCASLVAQMVKNLLAMWETWVRSLGLENPLEEGMATHSSILAWKISMDRGA